MSNKDFAWCEKYRPSTIDDVIIPAKVKAKFKEYIEKGQFPSLLLSSPSPGTGKTTTAKVLCKELGIRPLFINASKENSISDVRSQVSQYATTVSLLDDKIKCVILDEGERLSNEAQDALKGLSEEVQRNCVFIITANTKSRIIDALQSRCTPIDYIYTKEDMKNLSAQMYKRSCEILEAEGIEYNKRVVAAVVQKFSPDNRRILNFLQQQTLSGKLDEGALGELNKADASALIEAMASHDFGKVKQFCYDNADQIRDEFYGKVFKLLEPVVDGQSLANAVLILGNYQKYHSAVPDLFIHFLALCTELMMEVKFKG